MLLRTFPLALSLALLASVGCSSRSRPADVVPCSPGAMIQVGCAAEIGRACTRDPAIRVCDGATPPSACVEGAATELAFDDDSGSELCPIAMLLCPASGQITVVPENAGFCSWDIGPAPMVDRLAATVSCTPGALLAAGCDGTVGDLCRGDPTIRVCDGTLDVAACTASTTVLLDDDDGGEGVCPLGTFTCPASGRITVVPRGFAMRPPSDWDCFWDIGAPAI
jgi:hypothetical protein